MTTDSEHSPRGGNSTSPGRSDAAPITPGSTEDAPSKYGAVFAVREFRPIFAAHVLSVLGSVFAEVSLAVLVFRQTGSALLTALIFALGFLPYALSGILLSGIADRFPTRAVLVACDLVCAGCVAVMAVPATPIALLFVLRTLVSMVTPLFTGARAASLADILHGDLFVLGRSLVRIVSQSSQIVGYGVGGLVLVWLSPRTALIVTIGTFLCSALLLRFGTRDHAARVTGSGAMMRDSIASAGRLFGSPRIRALLLMWWLPPMFCVVAEGVAAPFADASGAGTAGFGVLLAAMPAGTVIGELTAGTLLGPASRERIAIPLAALSMVPFVCFVVHPSLPFAIVLLMCTGLCMAYSLGIDKWFVLDVPEEMRGRAMSLLAAGIMTLQGVGMTVGGAVAEWVPPYAVIAGAGALGSLSVLPVLKSVRRTRRIGAVRAA
ncbi:Predicted arabinose efflux permease, MFS family [Streptomyces sp. DvalAA-14]|uniref:MFS transporter n=1 Tax=unclassified Streptomyces TaxID=2593676 RepID=UPI00081B2CF2|nr:MULTISPECIES: MFS transporter [unclassified Streptomyces]MYS22559.1 MFS transporter [Streptomyces sp. SID4948]SCE18367.1 Predicted arabinose efflux permease, MFS family [Streptomyces sp. DvalAA-14]